jgi:ArsR family transcriptional regulator, arsenate/arsenite/antimonite-responsive transcriptional repressor / arsenate reductase (thioredoxin)
MGAKKAKATSYGFLELLAHEQRWNLLLALAGSDLRVQELMARVGEPANLVSYHLRRLREHALVRERRSSADARDVYYSLDLDRVAYLYQAAGASLHPGLVPDSRGLPGSAAPGATSDGAPAPATGAAPAPRRRVLFICTHNSARSQMAEARLRTQSGGRIEAASAGTSPTALHPLAIQVLAQQGIDAQEQRAKSLAAVGTAGWDRLVTVCDLAREACPALPEGVEAQHWSLPDPAAVEGSEEARRGAFEAVARDLRTRIRFLIAALAAPGALAPLPPLPPIDALESPR